jgi:hypothetical protein
MDKWCNILKKTVKKKILDPGYFEITKRQKLIARNAAKKNCGEYYNNARRST